MPIASLLCSDLEQYKGKDESMKNFSRELKKWRKSNGMSQDKLAEELNISRSDVSKIENGKKEPDIKTFLNWASTTNNDIQAAILLFGTDVITNAAQFISTLPMFIKLF